MLRDALARLGRHTLTYAAGGPLMYAVGFLLVPFYTHFLDKADYGVNELLTQLIAVLSLVAGRNMAAGMTRLFFEQKTPREQHAVITTTVLTVGAAATVLAAVLALAAPRVAPLLVGDTANGLLLFRITMAILVLQTVRDLYFNYLQAQQRSALVTGLSVAKMALQLSLQIWLIAVKRRGLLGLFEGVLIGEAVSVALLSVALLPTLGLQFSRPLFRQLVLFTLPLVPNGLFMFCLQAGDRFVLKGLADAEAVGLYGFSYKFGSIPMYFPLTPFLLVWFPYVFAIKDEDQRRALIGRVMPFFMLCVTAVVLGLALVSRELAHVMEGQPGYAASWPVIPIVAAGYWFWSLFQIVQTGFYVRKITRHLPWLSGMAAAVNLAANFLLIPRIGYLGAAWATLLTFVVLLVITVRVVRPVYDVAWPWRKTVAPALVGGAALAAGLLLSPDALVPALAFKLGLFVAWVVWVWYGGFFGREDRAAALSSVRTPFQRGG